MIYLLDLISRSYECDALLVNGLNPYDIYDKEKHTYSNHGIAKKLSETFTKWKNKGHVKFNAYAGFNFDFLLTSHTWFSNLYSFPWLFSTNACQMDTLPLARNMEYYNPNILKTDINKKNHKIFKLASLCAMNGFPIKDSHTAKDDTLGLKNLTEYLKKNDSELFNKNLQLINKKDVLPYVKKSKIFLYNRNFFFKNKTVCVLFFNRT